MVLVGVGAEGARVERHPEGVGEGVHVAEGGEHVLVARERPEVELVGPVHRGLGPEPGVGRVRVLVHLVGVRVVGRPGPATSVAVIGGHPPACRRSSRGGGLGDECGHVEERRVPGAGGQQGAGVRGLEYPDHPGVDAGPEGGGQPAVGLGADAVAEVAHVGARADQGHRAGVDEGRAVGGERDHVLHRALHPVGQRQRRIWSSTGGSASMRRHSTSASRWSLELK